MKNIPLLAIILGLTLFLSGQPAPAQTPEAPVWQTVVDFFQAMADLDFPKMRSYCQPDFELLEHGEVWTLAVLEDKLKPNVGTGMQRTNAFEFIKVTVKGKTAWVSYHNSARIVRQGQERNVHWLESAVLEKTRQGWKIALLHSTVKPVKK